MATVTVNEETISVVKKTVILELSEAEVGRIIPRLNMAPRVTDDNGVEIGPAITTALA